MYHAYNYLAPHELRIYGGFKVVSLVSGRDHGCLLKSRVPSNTWYAEICGCNCDVLRKLSESWDWMMR